MPSKASPSSRPYPTPQRKLAIGVDLGATKIAAALVDESGGALADRQVLTEPSQGKEAVLARIAALVNEITSIAAGLPTSLRGELLGVGIGTPGQVDSTHGVVRNAVNLDWEELHLVREVRTRLLGNLPVWIQKDANASALGEYYFGAAQGCPDFVYLGIGSGLGGGIFADGRLVVGANWNAAELGHLSLDPQGVLCACGLRGCAEMFVSGRGLVILANHLRARGSYNTRLAAGSSLNSASVVAAARQGDELALAALQELGRYLGIVMAACAATTNPARIVIGGGLGLAAFDLIVPTARQELARRVLAASHTELEILPSRQASSAVGAACLVWYFSGEQPL